MQLWIRSGYVSNNRLPRGAFAVSPTGGSDAWSKRALLGKVGLGQIRNFNKGYRQRHHCAIHEPSLSFAPSVLQTISPKNSLLTAAYVSNPSRFLVLEATAMPLILHNVPDDELYVGDDGVQRPYAMVFAQYVSPRLQTHRSHAIANSPIDRRATPEPRDRDAPSPKRAPSASPPAARDHGREPPPSATIPPSPPRTRYSATG